MQVLLTSAILIIINAFAIVPLIPKVDEETISKNITLLKKYTWFNGLLKDDTYRILIIHDQSVRIAIGKFKMKRMENELSNKKYQKKLMKVLEVYSQE